jgi:hypothetical protein
MTPRTLVRDYLRFSIPCWFRLHVYPLEGGRRFPRNLPIRWNNAQDYNTNLQYCEKHKGRKEINEQTGLCHCKLYSTNEKATVDQTAERRKENDHCSRDP